MNRYRILKFEKLPYPDLDPDSKILEQERIRSLKKRLRPPLHDTQLKQKYWAQELKKTTDETIVWISN